MLVRVLALLAALLVWAAPSAARAQQPDHDAAVARAMDELDVDFATSERAIAASDCAVACTALASMRRAAERLCALEPGARCAAARARVEDAARRVHAQCPECEAAHFEEPAETKPGAKKPDEALTVAPGSDGAVPESGARGGCRGCAVGTGDAGVALLAGCALAAFAASRRRRGARR